MLLLLPRRWRLTCIIQESSTLGPLRAPKRSPFSSATAAAYDFFSGGSTTGHNLLEEEAPTLGFPSDTDQRWVSPSFSLPPWDMDKAEDDESLLGGDDGVVGPPVVKSSSRLSLLAKCHSLARCGRMDELRGALRLLVAKEGSGSASSLCESLNHFRGWEQHGLLWDVLVYVYATYEMPHDALFALSKMNRQKIQASIFTYNSLMYTLRNTDVVWDLYGLIQAQGLPCSRYMHNILINHLCKQGWLRDAVSFFQDKRGRGELTPCIVTFNTLIAGCCSFGRFHGRSTGLI